MTDMPPRVTDEEVERLIRTYRAPGLRDDDQIADALASLLSACRALEEQNATLTAERDKWREDREDWRIAAASAWRQLIEAEAQVAALTATIEAQASVIGETRRRALPSIDALAQVIRRVDGAHSLGAGALAEAILAALSPQEANHG